MAKGKDELFGVSFDGLIDIPDENNEGVTPPASEKKTEEKKGKEKIADNAYVHPDGMIEIDEFAREKEKASEESEDDSKFIENNDTKKKSKETPSKDKSSDSSPSSSPYLAFAREQAEEGVFLDFTDEQWQELVERNEGDETEALTELHKLSVSAMIEQAVEKYKDSVTPEERLLYEAKEKGLPADKYSVAKRNYEKYSKITADQVKENPNIAEDVITKLLESRGYTQDEIKEEIEGYKALENLETKALKALELVPKAYKKEIEELDKTAKADEESRKDRVAQRVSKMKSLIDNTAEVIPGIKISKVMKEELTRSMSTPVATDDEGNPLNEVMATRAKNPEAFEMLIHYYHKLGFFNLDKGGNPSPDFTKILTNVKTKAVDNLRSAFETKENYMKSKSKIIKTDDDDDYDKAWSRLGKS